MKLFFFETFLGTVERDLPKKFCFLNFRAAKKCENCKQQKIEDIFIQALFIWCTLNIYLSIII